MNYCPERKLAFIMPTKTGTSTLEHFLSIWGTAKLDGNRHRLYKDIINSNPELKAYTFFGFYRDPLDRFLSICRHMYKVDKNLFYLGFPDSVYDNYVDTFYDELEKISYMAVPQVKWLQDVQLLDYRNYSQEILKLARIFNQSKVEMKVLNSTPKFQSTISQKVIDFVQSYYADDYRLGRERGLLK